MPDSAQRFVVHLSAEQGALIGRAAAAQGKPVSTFIAEAALAHAAEVLTDRRLFTVANAAWTEFLAALDRPVAHKPALAALFAEPTIFDDEPLKA